MNKNTHVTMVAVVMMVEDQRLLVCDCHTCQHVIVHTNKACCFAIGDCVCIHYNGIMTMSIPPQITAISIEKHQHHKC